MNLWLTMVVKLRRAASNHSEIIMKNNKKILSKKNRRGSSLIELLIAVMIVGSIVTATAIAMTYTLKNSAETRYRDSAVNLAQDGVELFRREREVRGWDNFFSWIPSGSSLMCIKGAEPVVGPFVPCATGDTFTVSNTTYKREARITKSTTAPNINVKVEVIVTWNIGSSDERQVTVTQILKDRF